MTSSEFGLATQADRRRTLANFLWQDHAYLRLGFQNARWLGQQLVCANQPWPFQLRRWREKGVRTVVNLRGEGSGSSYVLEKAACEELGLTLVNFSINSKDVPSADKILGAKRLFETLDYPALMHCKSGADRAGLMAVFYAHFQLGQPMALARRQLSLRYLHMNAGRTGLLDFFLDRYLAEAARTGTSFLDWVQSSDFSPAAIKADYRSKGLAALFADRVLNRE